MASFYRALSFVFSLGLLGFGLYPASCAQADQGLTLYFEENAQIELIPPKARGY
jgi:hypothetical protein